MTSTLLCDLGTFVENLIDLAPFLSSFPSDWAIFITVLGCFDHYNFVIYFEIYG